MAADFRFPSSASTAGFSSSRSSHESRYSTSASSTSSSSLPSSGLKQIPAPHFGSRPADPTIRSKSNESRGHVANRQLSETSHTVAAICSRYRNAEVILLERMARSARVGLPKDIAALKLVLCLYRGRSEIQRRLVNAESDGEFRLGLIWQQSLTCYSHRNRCLKICEYYHAQCPI